MENKSQLLSWAKFLIGWPLSFISLFFIVKIILDKGSKLNIRLSEINFLYLTASVLFFFAYYLMRSFLWHFLLKEKGIKISFKENTYRFTFSELKRYTPGNIWSFLSRASQFRQLGVDKKTIGAAIFADIQLVIVGCALASIPAIPWLINSQSELKSKVLALLPFSLIVIIIYFAITTFLYRRKYDPKSSFISSLFLPGYNMNSKFKLVLISVATYTIFGIGNYVAMLSVHSLEFSNFITLSSFFVFSLLIGYLSFITPMGLGVREGVVILGLSKLMSAADAGFVSIFTRIVLVMSELTFLFLLFIWKKTLKN